MNIIKFLNLLPLMATIAIFQPGLIYAMEKTPSKTSSEQTTIPEDMIDYDELDEIATEYIEECTLLDATKEFHNALYNYNYRTNDISEKKNYLKTIELLLKKGVNPNIPENQFSETLLIDALKNNDFDLAELLLNYNADPNLKIHFYNDIPLTIAIKKKNSGLTKLLLKHGANPNITHKYGDTLLIGAMNSNNFELAALLLSYNANPNLRIYSCNDMPLIIAIKKKNPSMTKLLLEHGADVNKDNPLCTAIVCYYETRDSSEKEFYFKIIHLLLERGADTNITQYSYLPLEIAILLYRDVALTTLLLQYKADPNAKLSHSNYPTYLDAVIFCRNFDLIKLFLEYGADYQENYNERIVIAQYCFSINELLSTLNNTIKNFPSKNRIETSKTMYTIFDKVKNNEYYFAIPALKKLYSHTKYYLHASQFLALFKESDKNKELVELLNRCFFHKLPENNRTFIEQTGLPSDKTDLIVKDTLGKFKNFDLTIILQKCPWNL